MSASKMLSAEERRKQAGQRALSEAEQRRQETHKVSSRPKEFGSQRAIEPTRYGDWERKGIASDF